MLSISVTYYQDRHTAGIQLSLFCLSLFPIQGKEEGWCVWETPVLMNMCNITFEAFVFEKSSEKKDIHDYIRG